MYLADLHVHTSVSDCSMTAEAVLQKAKEAGLTHLAFTDHDTTQQAWEHVRLAEKYGIHAVVGVEMSATRGTAKSTSLVTAIRERNISRQSDARLWKRGMPTA